MVTSYFQLKHFLEKGTHVYYMLWISVMLQTVVVVFCKIFCYTGLCGNRSSPLDIPDNTVRTYTLPGATRGKVYTVSIQAYVITTSDSVQSGWVDFNEVEPGSLLCVVTYFMAYYFYLF